MSATVKKLGKLHEVVADVLVSQLTATMIDPDTEEEVSITSDKAVANAIAFLKNNDITADLGTAAGLLDVDNELAKLREKRRSLMKTNPEDADGTSNTA